MSGLTVIVAATKSNGIGQNGSMPWHIPKDLAYFSCVTTCAPPGKLNALIMGRGTWESIPPKFRPLKNRLNAVLSRNSTYPHIPPNEDHATPTFLFPHLEIAVSELKARHDIHRVFIIGGSSLYQETLGTGASTPPSLQADRVLLTRIHEPDFPDCDVFLPDFLADQNGGSSWTRASHDALVEWVNFDVPEGVQGENGVKFDFQMWVKRQD
ncbi:hypothetical protein ID866_7662 [Astraeus odoratus]|nr:hypothetical protein ID866_7662 [Astraeus odoratus]